MNRKDLTAIFGDLDDCRSRALDAGCPAKVVEAIQSAQMTLIEAMYPSPLWQPENEAIEEDRIWGPR